MKKALRISIGLNMILIAGLVALSAAARRTSKVPPPLAGVAGAPTESLPEPKPFRWGQIESTNYFTYVRNLRHIGCPEQTIRDLIVADVDQLCRNRPELLPEKASLVARLLSEEKSPREQVQTSPGSSPAKVGTDGNVSMPLVWQSAKVAGLNLEESQVRAIAELRQTFLDQIGGTNQEPGNLDYLRRWQNAQPEIDERLAGLIGRKAYLDYEARAASGPQ